MTDIDDYADVLDEPQRRVWDRMAQLARDHGGTLMGGTAVAMHLRHRFSEDLDIMTLGPAPSTMMAMRLGQSFAAAHIVDMGQNACRALVDGVRVDIFQAPRRASTGPLGMRRVAADVEMCGMPVGSLPDLLATKLEVIRFRSKARDYIDLYAIDTQSGYCLEDGVGFYCQRFGHADLPADFGDTLLRLADPGTLPDDPAFASIAEAALKHLSERVPALRGHASRQYDMDERLYPPSPSSPRRSAPPALAAAEPSGCAEPPSTRSR